MNMTNTQDQIVDAADRLFYRKGFDHTSFAAIAEAVNISRGNFYYHFKTKDEILDAVIRLRLERTSAMLARWEEEAETPEDCIKSFIHIVIANHDKISLYGCPVGTLCSELSKLGHKSESMATEIFGLFREWLGKHFIAMGHNKDADALAMHVLAWSQGVASLSNAFRDEAFVKREVAQICDWLTAQQSAPTNA